MDKEQIIQMARDAGINVSQGYLLRFAGVEDDLERFAAAIRAATKEEDAKICEDKENGWSDMVCAQAIRDSK